MARINRIDHPEDIKTRELYDAVTKGMGWVPNMMATMARSPTVLHAYLQFNKILAGGSLPAALRQSISLAVSEADQCNYCLAAHSVLGGKAGLSESDLLDARHGLSSDPKINAALVFARRVVEERGHVGDADLDEVRRAGYSDGQIAEIVANVALTTFTNYFNQVAGTELDFPAVESLAAEQWGQSAIRH